MVGREEGILACQRRISGWKKKLNLLMTYREVHEEALTHFLDSTKVVSEYQP